MTTLRGTPPTVPSDADPGTRRPGPRRPPREASRLGSGFLVAPAAPGVSAGSLSSGRNRPCRGARPRERTRVALRTRPSAAATPSAREACGHRLCPGLPPSAPTAPGPCPRGRLAVGAHAMRQPVIRVSRLSLVITEQWPFVRGRPGAAPSPGADTRLVSSRDESQRCPTVTPGDPPWACPGPSGGYGRWTREDSCRDLRRATRPGPRGLRPAGTPL